ncbi:MAG: YceI family protein [Caldilineales bacterium]|nr:YceI family protein [Caldilineales bacterium]
MPKQIAIRRIPQNLVLVVVITFTLFLAACANNQASVEPDPPATTPAAAVPTAEPTSPEPEPGPTVADSTPPEASEETTAGDTKTVHFTLDPERSTASYSIDEIFIDENNKLATAIGRTSVLTGTLLLNYDDPTASEFGQFVADISTLQSDRSRRDRAIRSRWLESSKYPLATFNVTEIRNFPADPVEGVPIDFQIVGDLTLKEATREAVWDAIATLNGDELTGAATIFFLLEDYGIPVPSILGVLSVTDGLTLTLEFTMVADNG